MEISETSEIYLVIGGIFLITWYGLSQWTRDRKPEGKPPNLAPGTPGYRRAAQQAIAAEFRQSDETEEFYPGGSVFCPDCLHEYPAGILYCEKCYSECVDADDLEEALNDEPEPIPRNLRDEELVCVHIANSSWKASLLKQFLEGNDIPCATVGNVPSTVYPFANLPLAEVRLMVYSFHAARAKKLINEYMPSDSV